jgi:hypothetical protein
MLCELFDLIDFQFATSERIIVLGLFLENFFIKGAHVGNLIMQAGGVDFLLS